MIDIQGLTLILTRRCNAACRHCGFSSSRNSSETMEVEQARDYLSQAAKIKSIRMTSITGGEPFLFYDRILSIVGYAGSLGLSSEVVTNSFWAETEKAALARLAELQDRGLVNFVTSADEFHTRFIPIERVRNAVQAAAQLGLKVTVKITHNPASEMTESSAAQILKLAPGPLVSYKTAKLTAAGRAKGRLSKDQVPFAAKAFSGCCGEVIKFPAVNAGGELFPCCGFGQQNRLVGLTRKAPLFDLLLQMQQNLLFNLLAHAGPAGVWEKIKSRLPGERLQAFGSPCDVCNFLYTDIKAKKEVRLWLESLLAGLTPISEREA